jgi:sulfur relay (sulfurtransferase) complex TusBCD TusD component (DsrE family)
MPTERRAMLAAAITLAAGATTAVPVRAAPGAPLFVNATSDEPHRARMAITFAANQLERGHPVTLFWNDRGVLVVSTKAADRFGAHHEMIAKMLAKGAQVLVCPMCMEHYGVVAADLIPGAQVGNPDLTGAALFAPETRTLTW